MKPFSALVLFSGMGILACGKILGTDFNVGPEKDGGDAMGLTSTGGATGGASNTESAVTNGSGGSTVGGSGNRPDGLEGTGGADAEASSETGGTHGTSASDDSTSGGNAGEGGAAGATDGGSGGEVIDPPPVLRCSSTAPFTAVMKVPGISGAATLAHYSPDELTVYYVDARGTTLTIAKATRPTVDDPFGAAEPVAPLNELGFVASPSLTADGLTVYLESSATGSYRIYSSTRDSLEEAFPVPAAVAEIVADVGVEGGPFVSADGNDLYFHSTRNGNSELFRATRTAFGFQNVEELPVSTDEYLESFPAVSPDNLTLYFIRRPVSASSTSNTVLWRAIRSNVAESFTEAEPVTELDSPEATVELPDWVSEDNCRLYFSRMAAAQVWGGSALFVATREPEEP